MHIKENELRAAGVVNEGNFQRTEVIPTLSYIILYGSV